MIKTLVVDDSPTMRALIRAALSRDPGIVVIGEAGDPHEARAKIKALLPDVLTLDVEMPGMDGLDFLERLMRLRPMPVVMVSCLTSEGADTTLRALALGAVECVAKPGPGEAFEDLPTAVRNAAAARVQPTAPINTRPVPQLFRGEGAIIAIGASTGGVEALSAVLSSFPANCPPTLITQHIRPAFTRSLANRLDRLCAASVAEARDGEPLLAGRVYIAPGGTHLAISGTTSWRCSLLRDAPVNGHCPSVDVLFDSVARFAGERAVGVILTGMGKDGAQGLLAIRKRGGRTIGQDAETSVVYGMPRAAFEIGAVELQVPLRSIAARTLAAATSLNVGAA
jgi:two-component system chemotaxis response regulator CheB